MNSLTSAISKKIGDAKNTLLGRSFVNNKDNPNSASYKVSQSVGQPSKQNKLAPGVKLSPMSQFKSSLPNQKTYGIGWGP